MSSKIYLVLLTAVLTLMTCFEIDARGGGGRGGGAGRAGGGGARGGSYARTPSMSRANVSRNHSQINRPAASQARNRATQQRPVNTQINRQAIQNARGNVQRPSQTQINTARQNFSNNYSSIRNSQRQASEGVRNAIRNNHSDYRGYFNNNFYDRFGYQPRWDRPGYNAWGAASWYGVNSWLGGGWSDPYYYDTGPTYVEVPSEYASQYSSGGAQTPAVPQQPQGDWMSLGVFAISQNEQTAAYSNKFVELVVDKSGTIAGTYYNAAADQVHPLDGFIDKDAQQVVWRVADNANSPIMTAGVYNLTQDMADVKVRYNNGTEQYWKMVRLEQ